MKKLGHLHYERRAMSTWCLGVDRAGTEQCPGAFLSGDGSHFITLCTCACHPFNAKAKERSA